MRGEAQINQREKKNKLYHVFLTYFYNQLFEFYMWIILKSEKQL